MNFAIFIGIFYQIIICYRLESLDYNSLILTNIYIYIYRLLYEINWCSFWASLTISNFIFIYTKIEYELKIREILELLISLYQNLKSFNHLLEQFNCIIQESYENIITILLKIRKIKF